MNIYLTNNEATTLARLLLNHITGPDEGPRGVLSAIGWELSALLNSNDTFTPFKAKTNYGTELYLSADD